MILGDLLDAEVHGPDGGRLGYVVDVRFAMELVDEPGTGASAEDEEREHRHPHERPASSETAGREAVGSATLVGLLVSPRTARSFLGYERSDVASPWPIAQWVRWRHRGTFLVRWDDVAEVRAGQVRLAEGYRREDPGLP